jgi:hypothetical protein
MGFARPAKGLSGELTVHHHEQAPYYELEHGNLLFKKKQTGFIVLMYGP